MEYQGVGRSKSPGRTLTLLNELQFGQPVIPAMQPNVHGKGKRDRRIPIFEPPIHRAESSRQCGIDNRTTKPCLEAHGALPFSK